MWPRFLRPAIGYTTVPHVARLFPTLAAIDSQAVCAEAFSSAMPFDRKKDPKKQAAVLTRWHMEPQQLLALIASRRQPLSSPRAPPETESEAGVATLAHMAA